MTFFESKVPVWILTALNLVFGLVCLGTVASLLTSVDSDLPPESQDSQIFQGSWIVGGRSAPVLLFFTASAALLQGLLHAAVVLDALKTRFMVVLQGALALFFLASSVSTLALVSDPKLVMTGSQKNITVAAASFGVLCAVTHGLTAALAFHLYST